MLIVQTENPDVVDVYELVINGQEISPGYSELNDPDVQKERLEHQAAGETQRVDYDFIETLEYGMPSAGGIGIGIATGKATEAISRQPEASGKIQTNLLLGAALAEGTAIFGFVVALLIILFLG